MGKRFRPYRLAKYQYPPKVGFPKSFKFQTQEELDRYFGEDSIVCLLCGNSFRKLGNHLIKAHSMTGDEYKAGFGIPWKTGLACTEFKDNLSEQMAERKRSGELPATSESVMRKMHECAKHQRPKQPVTMNKCIDRISTVNKAIKTGELVISEEARKKMGEPGRKKAGIPLTDEHRAKISRAKIGITRGAISEETRRKLSKARKKYWATRKAER